MGIQAGWYRDETSPGFDRYWDGNWWTADTRESTKSDESPPSPPSSPAEAPSIESAESERAPETSNKTILTMNEVQFTEVVSDLSDRVQTHVALLKLWRIEVEGFYAQKNILAAHADNLDRSLIRRKIQEGIAWQKNEVQEAVNELGVAMREDFDETVRWLGGAALLPVPIEQAWENFNAPVKTIVEAIAEEMHAVLTEVANIEDEYLFV
jgi:hypothetical protein